MSTKEPELWVGEFEDGEVVVFDPQAQTRSEPDWVYLWSRETQQTDRYAKDIVKKVIRSMAVADEAKSVLDNYLSIRDAHKKLVQDNARDVRRVQSHARLKLFVRLKEIADG